MEIAIDNTVHIGGYTLVAVRDLDESICPDPIWLSDIKDSGHIRVYDKSLVVDGNLNLDLYYCDMGCEGIIVQGDLTVNGSIINGDFNSGIYLHVMGAAHANNLISSGGYINLRKAYIKYFSVGIYNDGRLKVGFLDTKVMLNDDHATTLNDENIDISVGCSMRTGGNTILDIRDLAKYWSEQNILADTISFHTSEVEGLEHDGRVYSLDTSAFSTKILNGEEEVLLERIHQYSDEIKARNEILNLPLDLQETVQVTWDHRIVTGIYLNGVFELEYFLNAITPSNLRYVKNLVLLNVELNEELSFIGHLPYLNRLVLRRNNLCKFPSWINELNKLVHLDLAENEIDKIPESIGRLEQLEVLNLSNNSLSNIPENIGNLTNLSVLDISHNELNQLPDSLHNLKELRKLKLQGNNSLSGKKNLVNRFCTK